MKNMRGVLILVIAVVCGLVAAKMAAGYLKQSESNKDRPPKAIPSDPEPLLPPPPPFTEAIPDGMRAISIPVDEVTGVSHKVKRGDRVDVIAITAAPTHEGARGAGHGAGRISRVILQSVEVLAAARENSPQGDQDVFGAARHAKKWVATLLLNPADAATVTAADASGKLALMVRNPKDTETSEPAAMMFSGTQGAKPYRREKRVEQGIPDVRHLIRPGMRAFTLEAKVTDGIGGSVRPGDHVDIMLTCPFGHFSASGHDVGAEGQITSTHMASRIFLQNIEVLAVADRQRVVSQPMPASFPGPEHGMPQIPPMPQMETSKTVVLHVTPEHAELLAVATDATSKSILRLIARNPNDHEPVDTQGQLLIELLTEKREYTSVEVVRGNEQKVRKFFRYRKGGIATRSEGFNMSPVTNSDDSGEKAKP